VEKHGISEMTCAGENNHYFAVTDNCLFGQIAGSFPWCH